MKRERPAAVSGTIREAILESGETLYRVAKDSGVSYATIHGFMTGKRTLSMDAIDKLCIYLGLRLSR
jgi:plasmid maintenance system antidote protein VapI